MHDGELTDVAVPLEQLNQPGQRLRPAARPSEGNDLAVLELQDGLDVEQ